ncbi:MarR family winged helix-turn-helix transcriptional regulator [Streptomyces sp. NPDC090306]|uniref:MarR family winged helix-turn-helix transcriptional regulator n=1 Tax=unclassified Streptomyces TaxID=2593676 RepID=UPI0036E18146
MTGVPLSDVLSSRLGYLFKDAHYRLGDRLVAALAPFRLIPRELGVMAVIGEGGQERSQMELAAELGLDRTTMVIVIDALEGKGYVERRRSERDRRRNVVSLTPAGAECLRNAEAVRVGVEEEFLAPLDPRAARTLTAALVELNRAHAAEGGERPGTLGVGSHVRHAAHHARHLGEGSAAGC